MTTDEELDARFAAADRAARLGEHEPALVELFSVAEGESLGRRRRRAFTRAGIGGALVIALGLGAPAAAAAIRDFLAQTGSHCSGTECGNYLTLAESEWIDSSAPDFAIYVDSLFPRDLPLADGVTREDVVGRLVASIESTNATDAANGYGANQFGALGLSSSLEFSIYCGWITQWIAADAEGDDGSAQRAAQVMRQAAEWPAIVKTDGDVVVEHILFYADAADRGEAATVAAGARSFACDYLLGQQP